MSQLNGFGVVKESHLLGINLNFHWPEKQQCEFKSDEPCHPALLSDAMSGIFLKCAFGVTRKAIQSVHNVTGGDKTIHPFSGSTKPPTPRKQQYIPKQIKQMLINLVQAAGCLTKLLSNRRMGTICQSALSLNEQRCT